jgi:hypothetical protein
MKNTRRNVKRGGTKAVTKTLRKSTLPAKKSTSVLFVKGRSIVYLKNLREFLDGFQRKFDRAAGNSRKEDNLSILALLLSTELSGSLTDNHALLESKKDDLESLLARMSVGNGAAKRNVFGDTWDELFDTTMAEEQPVEYLDTFNTFITSYIKEYKKLFNIVKVRGNASALSSLSNMDAFADIIRSGVRVVFKKYLRILKVKAEETKTAVGKNNVNMGNAAANAAPPAILSEQKDDIDDIANLIGDLNL